MTFCFSYITLVEARPVQGATTLKNHYEMNVGYNNNFTGATIIFAPVVERINPKAKKEEEEDKPEKLFLLFPKRSFSDLN